MKKPAPDTQLSFTPSTAGHQVDDRRSETQAAATPIRHSPHEPDTLPPDIAARARRLLVDLARPELKGYAVLVVLLLAFGLGNAIGPAFIGRAMDDGIPAAIAGDTEALVVPLAAFLLVTLGTGLADFFGTRLTGTLAQRLMVALRKRMFDHVQRLGIAYHERSTSGRLVSRQTSDMENIQTFLTGSLQQMVVGFTAMVAIAITLIVMDWRLALVVFLGFIPLLGVSVSSNRAQRRNQRRTRTAIAKVIVHIMETLGGIRAVQSFRREAENNRRLITEDAEFRDATAASLRNNGWFGAGTRLIGNLSMASVLLVGGWLVIGDALQIGMLTAFLLYVRRFYGPIDELVQSLMMYQSASAALEKITGVLDAEPEVRESAEPRSLAPVTGHPGGRAVEFDTVHFSYSDGVPVLAPFSLHIPAGQTVALVGATGAGKSTLVKLLARFYDPVGGRIRLDGVDLRDIADQELRQAVVMVTQESYLFGGSIADNIRIGRPSATDAHVAQAADAVGLTHFIERMPDGFDTDVRKRGGRLSSGQRQLVSFARAFLANPDVLVLDEATAQLDIPSERQVQRALATVLDGRSAVIIAHRLSTVEIADRVLVMESGRIVEDGSPNALITSGGRFARLHGAWEDSRA